ncbi:hypothetical protein HDU96_005501 [Phlyctochytrium bullatum]|nr:hypothetical protein HDU96_005501 [Phlyctochytrium bullatum]
MATAVAPNLSAAVADPNAGGKKKKKVVLTDAANDSDQESGGEGGGGGGGGGAVSDSDAGTVASSKPGKKKGKKGGSKSDGDESEGGGKKKKKKGKKGKKEKGEGKKNMVMNARGELVSAAQFALETTLEATNQSLASYRSRMENLIKTNEDLQETCQQQEKDALDVIAALHAETEHKEAELKRLRDQMETALHRGKLEQEALMIESEKKIQEMNNVLAEKEAAFRVMQAEFAVIKDFRKKRHELLRELEYQKQELADTERQHKEEAVANLKETTKEVYKENIRMAESLRYHVQEGEELQKQNTMLLRANRQLMEEKDLHNVIVKEKILQAKQQAQEIKDLNLKIQSMEHALSHVVREFEHERDIIGKMARRELDEVRRYADKLRECLKRKSKEMRHIRRLAQHILDQRTDLEAFFMDALDHVRAEIQSNREMAKKAAQADYNRKIRAVMSQKQGIPYPAVQSFRPQAINNLGPAAAAEAILHPPEIPRFDSDSSASAAGPSHDHHSHAHPADALNDGKPPHPPSHAHHQHHHAALKPPPHPSTKPHAGAAPAPAGGSDTGRVDISELSWDDKERVLRLLFAKMNGMAVGGMPSHHNAGRGGARAYGRGGDGGMYGSDDGADDDYHGGHHRVGFSAAVPEGREVDIDGVLELSTTASPVSGGRPGLMDMDQLDDQLERQFEEEERLEREAASARTAAAVAEAAAMAAADEGVGGALANVGGNNIPLPVLGSNVDVNRTSTLSEAIETSSGGPTEAVIIGGQGDGHAAPSSYASSLVPDAGGWGNHHNDGLSDISSRPPSQLSLQPPE